METMHQVAPYPSELAEMVTSLRYREHFGWTLRLENDCQRDAPGRHSGESRGLTLVVQRRGPNSYHPVDSGLLEDALNVVSAAPGDLAALQALAEAVRAERQALIAVNHYFAVPPATYNRQSWMQWLFDRLGDVDTHERMEDFIFADGTRPYAPNHGPGWSPYLITVERTEIDRRTSFRGDLNPVRDDRG